MSAVDVNTDELQAAGKRLQLIAVPLKAATDKASETLEPQWKALVSANASTRLERRVVAASARAVVIEGGIRIEAGKSGGSLRGGLSVAAAAGPAEYGADRGKRKTYRRRSRKGGSHSVTRRTSVQFRAYNGDGYVFGPAVKAFIPKVRDSWFEGFKVVVTDSIEGV